MRWLRSGLALVLVVKAAVLGVWWWESIARAERSASAAEAAAEAGVGPDLFTRSRGFRELLDAVHRRGEELERREQAVAAREGALRALEQALVARAEGGSPAAPASPLPAPAPPVVEAQAPVGCAVALTKIYQSMRPEEAAPIDDRLDDATARSIFGCMKEKQIGAILGAMSRDRAVALTKVLSGTPTSVASAATP
jgi:flagellar motility protein MotE (MotC chaperone)